MKADEMTVQKFDEILPKLQFSLLTYPTRYSFEGAGPRCLVAEYGEGDDGVTVLFEDAEFEIYGYDPDPTLEFGSWAVRINSEYGDRIQIM